MMKDGRIGYLTGWCDTTGWGCQDGAQVDWNGSTDKVQVARLIRTLQQYSYRTADENKLQEGIAAVLIEHGFISTREHVAGDDRFDFLLDGGIVIEAKIAGSWTEAIRQAERYCRQDLVCAVILASSRRWTADQRPQTFHGKPVHTVLLRGRF